MPIDYKKYPKDWKTVIRPAILERDENCCKQCGVPNKAVGYWGKNGVFFTVADIIDLLEKDGYDCFKEGNFLDHVPVDKKPITIVLTIAHLDHDITNNDYSNLAALCQKHHLAYDQNHHKETRKKKKGLQDMFK